jgi:hypothetical protein
LDSFNEANFQKAYQKFNQDLTKKYSIEPKILALEEQIEADFQDRKAVQAKINHRLEEERTLLNKSQQLFPKKSHITPPFYRLKIDKSPNHQNNPQIEQNNSFNKGTQTVKATQQAISQLFFNGQAHNNNNPDFNLNRANFHEAKNKYFHSEGKKPRENRSPQAKNDPKMCRNCEIKLRSPETNARSSVAFFSGEMNKILLEAKSLITRKKLPEAERLLEHLIRKNVNHADLFYLLGETKRLLGFD